ncbi:MAG: hypothetical protein ACPGVO_00890 [Spirulinaceae cyanobacterium]
MLTSTLRHAPAEQQLTRWPKVGRVVIDIVLAYHAPIMRQYDGFAIA